MITRIIWSITGLCIVEGGGKAGAVVRIVQEALGIVENILFGYAFTIARPCLCQDEIRHPVAADVLAFARRIEKRGRGFGAFFVVVEREAFCTSFKGIGSFC